MLLKFNITKGKYLCFYNDITMKTLFLVLVPGKK